MKKNYNCIKDWWKDKIKDNFKKLSIKEQEELLPELHNILRESKVIHIGQQQLNIVEDDYER